MKEIKKIPSCSDIFDEESLSLEIAIKNILNVAQPLKESESIGIATACNRIAYEDIQSAIDIPQYNNSAMDGYAVKFSDIKNNPIISLDIIGQSLAGHPFNHTVASGQCVRIMTGGVMPKGTDSVVMQEHAERKENIIVINNEHRYQQNVRHTGEDIKKRVVIIKRGTKLTPAHIGLLASVGVPHISVFRQLNVCIFSTGDELRPVGNTLNKGEIYDSNRYTLGNMLRRLHVNVTDLGVIKDNQSELRKAFQTASLHYDAVITSGGVSVGEADYTKNIFCEIGNIDFWKIAVKPGRPVAFGKLGDGLYFGLPGNPVSVMATFYILVQPALKKIMGLSNIHPWKLRAKCSTSLRKKAGRAEIQRGITTIQDDGTLSVKSTGSQGSGILSSMTQANCFIHLAVDTETVNRGDEVWIIPFEGLI